MPKLGITTLNDSFSQSDLEVPVANIEWVLEGKLDGDNLAWSGDRHVVIPSGKIQDSPYNGNPVYNHKFMPDLGPSSTDSNFKLNIYDTLFDILLENPQYTLAEAAVSFNATPLLQESVTSYLGIDKIIKDKAFISSGVLTNKAIVEKPEHHKLLYLDSLTPYIRRTPKYYEYMNSTMRSTRKDFNPAIIPMISGTYKFEATKKRLMDLSFDLHDYPEKTEIEVKLSLPALDDGEYVYLGFRFLCLYEVLL